MPEYHMRHPHKAMDSREDIDALLASERLMTIAMCRDGEPYLVTVDYGYDPGERCFYFHCATRGKKMDYLRANPTVWGQVMADDGYVQTECEHRFRSVHFRGRAEVVEDLDEIKKALVVLIDQQEDEPGPVAERLLAKVDPTKLAVVRIRVDSFTGKRNG
ncbi:MAG: pyridoxamine 5'-phosphate oxidase family protein [Thermoplasmata archaeon]|nr:pyridoxamine 5'-phosphate oxidase family protein [Thermoplasmata archaeon]